MCAIWATIGFAVSTASAQVKPPEASNDDYAVAKHKLATIIIPRLELHDALLTDAIEQIRNEGARLDADPHPAALSFSIFLKFPAGKTEQATRITLTLTNTSVLDALKSVAGQVELKVKVDPYAILLVPLSENTEPMSAAEYLVPPAVIGLKQGPILTPPTDQVGFNGTITRQDATPWLESKGITFPPGASATYLTDKHKLVVRETQENLDRIKALLNQPPKNP